MKFFINVLSFKTDQKKILQKKKETKSSKVKILLKKETKKPVFPKS